MTDSAFTLSQRRRQTNAARTVGFLLSLLPLTLILIITAALTARFWPLLGQHSLYDLLSGTEWRPAAGKFGFWPFIVGTLWVTAVGVLLAAPPSLLTALYLSEYARPSTRAFFKPILDVLAALPSVVYGVWGVILVVPFVGNVLRPFFDQRLGWIPLFASNQPTGYSILSGGIVLAVMIAPFIIAVTFEVLMTAPQDWRLGSLSIGATRWQTTRYIILRQSMPGILAGIVLGTSRAFGETMAVLMVAGNVPQLPVSIFDAAYPLPALIANNYGEMMSIPLYDAALLGAALILLIIVFVFNIASTLILRRALRKRSL